MKDLVNPWPRIVMSLIIGAYSAGFMHELLLHNVEGATVCFGLAISTASLQFSPDEPEKR